MSDLTETIVRSIVRIKQRPIDRSGSAGSVDTFRILTEAGDFLTDESGNRLRTTDG